MDRNTQQEIDRMVEALQDMAHREFGDFKSSEHFETHVSSGDDHIDRVRLIGEGVRKGLHDHFKPQNVSVFVDETGYRIKIDRS